MKKFASENIWIIWFSCRECFNIFRHINGWYMRSIKWRDESVIIVVSLQTKNVNGRAEDEIKVETQICYLLKKFRQMIPRSLIYWKLHHWSFFFLITEHSIFCRWFLCRYYSVMTEISFIKIRYFLGNGTP